MLDLSTCEVILLDLDGTLYHDDDALPGAAAFVAELLRTKRRFACLSNSTASPSFIARRLTKLGMNVPTELIYPASAAACDYVVERFTPIATAQGRPVRVFNCATEAVDELLAGRATLADPEEPCDAVIVGTPCGYAATPERQRAAVVALRNGAELVGICADRLFPSPRGIEIGAGALTALLAYAADVKPVFCGKPEPVFFHELCRRLNTSPDRCVIIGDNPEADIAGGRGVGMKTILTLTGITARADLPRLPPRCVPDEVIQSLQDLLPRLQ